LSLGSIGGFLVIKLVKPTKVFCSWASDKGKVDELLFAEAKSHIRTAATGVLRKADTAVRKKLGRLDTSDGFFY